MRRIKWNDFVLFASIRPIIFYVNPIFLYPTGKTWIKMQEKWKKTYIAVLDFFLAFDYFPYFLGHYESRQWNVVGKKWKCNCIKPPRFERWTGKSGAYVNKFMSSLNTKTLWNFNFSAHLERIESGNENESTSSINTACKCLMVYFSLWK